MEMNHLSVKWFSHCVGTVNEQEFMEWKWIIYPIIIQEHLKVVLGDGFATVCVCGGGDGYIFRSVYSLLHTSWYHVSNLNDCLGDMSLSWM
jgi:hypothetical protein